MEKIYFALVDTPGLFASIIRKVIKIDYIHVVLSFDPELKEAYSVGRRNPYIPFFAGFEREDREQICGAFPTARYKIVAIEVTKEQKQELLDRCRWCWQHRYHYRYCILGLPFLLFQKPYFQEQHYTCTSFISRLLEEHGIKLFDKHFSLVTPRDFYELEDLEVVYEGSLMQFLVLQKYAYTEGAVYEG